MIKWCYQEGQNREAKAIEFTRQTCKETGPDFLNAQLLSPRGIQTVMVKQIKGDTELCVSFALPNHLCFALDSGNAYLLPPLPLPCSA